MLSQQLLSIERPIKRPPTGIVAGACVIAADDEMAGAVILADDCVPQRLARATHAHRQRQQR